LLIISPEKHHQPSGNRKAYRVGEISNKKNEIKLKIMTFYIILICSTVYSIICLVILFKYPKIIFSQFKNLNVTNIMLHLFVTLVAIGGWMRVLS
jgi:hypothetical protein